MPLNIVYENGKKLIIKIIPIQNAGQYFCVSFVVLFGCFKKKNKKIKIPKYLLRKPTEKLE